MDVHLTTEESTALQQALRSYTSDLRMEIVDTDNPDFKAELRHERTLLEGVLARLDEALDSSALRDDAGKVYVRMVGIWAGCADLS